ncbi:MAG: prepilin peptidase [Sporichthyaceae bacterium]
MTVRLAGDPTLPAILFVSIVGVALARIDIAVRRLPFVITVPMFPAAAALLIAPAAVGSEVSLLRAATSAGVWLATYWTIHVASRGRGLGLGDVVLAPTLGLVLGGLGWGPSLVGLVAGFLLAATLGAVLLVGGRATMKAAIPFGPFMLAGAALGALIGEAAWAAYLGTG